MKTNGLWKIKESQEKYKNHWIRIREDKVIQPDGKDGIIGVVEARDGVSILPVDGEGYVYLADQFRYIMEKNCIETAGGSIDDDEQPLSAARRELREELGIEAEEWVDLGLINPFTIAQSSQRIFLAIKLRFGKDNQEGSENIKLVKVKLEEAVKMVMDSVITNGPSCVLILKANEYLKNTQNG